MYVALNNNIIDRILVWAYNTREKYTHWVWNRTPHIARCKICGDTISTYDEYGLHGGSPSPEERGWKQCDRYTWICHSCLSHRRYYNYVELANLDEEIGWYHNGPKFAKDVIDEKVAILERKLAKSKEVQSIIDNRCNQNQANNTGV